MENGDHSWGEQMRGLPFVENVVQENHVTRLLVKDVRHAQAVFLDSLVSTGQLVRRFEVVQPSLEDVFLRLTDREV
jgi:ABC-type uncharacterized transport system ATPase subunit